MLDRDKNQKGFTLIELIVVLAVASVLTAVFVPQFYHYVGNSKESSCRQARENLLAIFERKVYAGEYTINDIDTFLTSPEFEVTDNTCPESGIYEGEVTGNRVSIKCKFSEHKDDLVFADIEGFNGTETTESDDNPIPIPTLPPIVTPSVTEAVPTEGEPVNPVPTWKGIWPYQEDYDEKKTQHIKIYPSSIFMTKKGSFMVIYSDRYSNNPGMYIGHAAADDAPEKIASQTDGWGFLSIVGGLYEGKPVYNQLPDIQRGNLFLYNGQYYLYTTVGGWASYPPASGANGWYLIPDQSTVTAYLEAIQQ